jgi:Tetracyclin repressor-like, C-terminal domain
MVLPLTMPRNGMHRPGRADVQASRELPSADADQLAFLLAANLAGANLAYVLHDDPALLDRARGAVDALLSGAAC